MKATTIPLNYSTGTCSSVSRLAHELPDHAKKILQALVGFSFKRLRPAGLTLLCCLLRDWTFTTPSECKKREEFNKLSAAETSRAWLSSSDMKTLILVGTAIGLMAFGPLANGEEAKVIYENQCAKCHGSDGKGDTKFGKKLGAKDYTDPKVQAALKDDAAFKAIKEGLKDGEKILMKPAEKVTDADIKALIAHMRGFKKG